MQKLQVNISGRRYRILLIASLNDVEAAILDLGIQQKAQFRELFGKNPPDCVGACYPGLPAIVIALSGGKNSIIATMKRCIGAAVAHELGLDSEDEELAQRIADIFTNTGRVTFLLRSTLEKGMKSGNYVFGAGHTQSISEAWPSQPGPSATVDGGKMEVGE
uniref:Uncharacterized protein n=1 Tax=viral metagenome TaxID=1070528 RepID=A0A2V0RIF8_9ZZZZ